MPSLFNEFCLGGHEQPDGISIISPLVVEPTRNWVRERLHVCHPAGLLQALTTQLGLFRQRQSLVADSISANVLILTV